MTLVVGVLAVVGVALITSTERKVLLAVRAGLHVAHWRNRAKPRETDDTDGESEQEDPR
ncbi:hypothetical protein RhoFasSB10_01301 [Rhodococcus fascians]|uniref:hypothetical protein n=1 Tax=Rhodococcoides fascians TaxID=1828 RepID=UPI001427C6ED|nr:hypothetical protein [Rhodococcus fascians]